MMGLRVADNTLKSEIVEFQHVSNLEWDGQPSVEYAVVWRYMEPRLAC